MTLSYTVNTELHNTQKVNRWGLSRKMFQIEVARKSTKSNFYGMSQMLDEKRKNIKVPKQAKQQLLE